MAHRIELVFADFTLDAELFDTKISAGFINNLPYTVSLTKWGDELYGSIGKDLGEESPVPVIPPGGIAYTNNGNYLCIFFGQTPAWAVEHIGQISGNTWQTLVESPPQKTVTIRLKD